VPSSIIDIQILIRFPFPSKGSQGLLTIQRCKVIICLIDFLLSDHLSLTHLLKRVVNQQNASSSTSTARMFDHSRIDLDFPGAEKCIVVLHTVTGNAAYVLKDHLGDIRKEGSLLPLGVF